MTDTVENAGPIEWREPPARTVPIGRGRPNPWIDRLAEVQANPQRWAMIRRCDSAKRAGAAAASLRKSKNLPSGKWEIRSSGEEVFARFVGPE